MTDNEINRKCAEKMSYFLAPTEESKAIPFMVKLHPMLPEEIYDPLHDDAQAMALVKKFEITTLPLNCQWRAVCAFSGSDLHTDLNHAICECVARMP